jgi:hypothetical protein
MAALALHRSPPCFRSARRRSALLLDKGAQLPRVGAALTVSANCAKEAHKRSDLGRSEGLAQLGACRHTVRKQTGGASEDFLVAGTVDGCEGALEDVEEALADCVREDTGVN